jgi:hypothetical protein
VRVRKNKDLAGRLTLTRTNLVRVTLSEGHERKCEMTTWLDTPPGWRITNNAPIAKSPPPASIARSVKREGAYALILDVPGGLRSVFINRSRKLLIADVLEWMHTVIPSNPHAALCEAAVRGEVRKLLGPGARHLVLTPSGHGGRA